MNRDKTGNRPLLPEHNRRLARFNERVQLVLFVVDLSGGRLLRHKEMLLCQCSWNKGESGYHWGKIYTGLGALTQTPLRIVCALKLGAPPFERVDLRPFESLKKNAQSVHVHKELFTRSIIIGKFTRVF